MSNDVHTSYFAALENEKVEPSGCVFGVVRNPHQFVHGVVDRNVRALGPPEVLLEAAKKVEAAAEADGAEDPMAVAWETVDFAERYRSHLAGASTVQVLRSVRERLANGDVWLVCYEKDPRHCHRRLLAEELTRGRETAAVHHPDPGFGADQEDSVVDARLEDFQEERA